MGIVRKGKTSERIRNDGGAGLECRSCGCRHLPVVYTRQRGATVVRVRECRNCGRRLRTREEGV